MLVTCRLNTGNKTPHHAYLATEMLNIAVAADADIRGQPLLRYQRSSLHAAFSVLLNNSTYAKAHILFSTHNGTHNLLINALNDYTHSELSFDITFIRVDRHDRRLLQATSPST